MRRSTKLLLAAALVPASAAAGGTPATTIDANMGAAVRLPLTGPVRQLSGPEVRVGDDGGLTAPKAVCTLVFQAGEKRAVVRVWEDKDHRVFVSAGAGDDANPGTESKPFRTIQRAVQWVLANDKDRNTDVYVAGGDYRLGETTVTVTYRISLYGGFDEDGWRRDPAVQRSVLLPRGFRENWIDDLPDRFKDLRRADHRCRETRIWKTYTPKSKLALDVGTRGSQRPETTGTRDTYIDGLTVFGCNRTGIYQPGVVYVSSINDRTIRNCIFVMFWSNGHAFMPGGGGRGLWENNIFWGGILGHQGHARPQMVFRSGAHMRRNLHVGATGGDYTRMFLCWGQGGTVEDSQIHGGNSFGWSTMLQGHHGGMKGSRDYVFRRNLVLTEYVGRPCLLAGLVCRDNTFHVRRAGFTQLWATRNLELTGNSFHCMARATKDNVFPSGPDMVQRLGGTFLVERDQPVVLRRPGDPDARRPVLRDNRIREIPDFGRRPANFVDIGKLSALVKARGEDVCVRPVHPATELRAAGAGAGKVRLTWRASRDTDVVGYRVYYGPRSNSYAKTHVVTGATEAEISGLAPGKWHFSVAAHKAAFVECWTLSNEAVVTVR